MFHVEQQIRMLRFICKAGGRWQILLCLLGNKYFAHSSSVMGLETHYSGYIGLPNTLGSLVILPLLSCHLGFNARDYLPQLAPWECSQSCGLSLQLQTSLSTVHLYNDAGCFTFVTRHFLYKGIQTFYHKSSIQIYLWLFMCTDNAKMHLNLFYVIIICYSSICQCLSIYFVLQSFHWSWKLSMCCCYCFSEHCYSCIISLDKCGNRETNICEQVYRWNTWNFFSSHGSMIIKCYCMHFCSILMSDRSAVFSQEKGVCCRRALCVCIVHLYSLSSGTIIV